jgi:hypothetical protein
VPVVLRTDLIVEAEDTKPIIVVAPGPALETIRFQTFLKDVVYDYQVLVALIWPGNRTLSADLEAYTNLREAIRNQLYQIDVIGLQTAFDTDMKTGSVSKLAAVLGSNYRITGWQMMYSVREMRGK